MPTPEEIKAYQDQLRTEMGGPRQVTSGAPMGSLGQMSATGEVGAPIQSPYQDAPPSSPSSSSSSPPGALGAAPPQAEPEIDANMLTQLVMEHEGLEPFQTPFRITSDKMGKWKTMFDDTIKLELDPNAKKGKGRQKFLYLKNQEDLLPAISEQFRRYSANPKQYGLSETPTIEEAIRKFDQTGADGKIKFLEENGLNTSRLLEEFFE